MSQLIVGLDRIGFRTNTRTRLLALMAGIVALVMLALLGPSEVGAVGLEAFAGVVGGVPNTGVPGPCSTYAGPPPEATFFGGGNLTMSVPVGGIAACGYSGDLKDALGTVGPVSATQSLGPVLLGNPGATGLYNGDASATADYGKLGAASSGNMTAPAGSPLALNNSSAASFFEETFTATGPSSNPLVTTLSPGFARYTFHFGGSLSVPTAQVSGMLGLATAQLHISHDGGAVLPLVRVDAGAGGVGTLTSLDGSTGSFVSGPGSIAGAGEFTSSFTDGFGVVRDLPITWGVPFSVEAGLLSSVLGTGDSSFLTTATLVKTEFFDSNHQAVTDVTLVSASGTHYGPCAFAIAPTSQTFGPAGGGDSVDVTAPAGCTWTAASNDPGLVTVTSGASGNGPGSVGYTVSANSGAPRQGTLTIAGQTFTVNQGSGCTFSIAPSNASFPAGGGTDKVTVTTGAGCAWSASTNDSSIATITSGATGSGPGPVQYMVSANNGPARQGTLTVAGQTFTINQDSGCTFSILPASAHLGTAGGSGSVTVAAGNGCAWTAVSQDPSWLTVTSGSSGSGQGSVGYSVAANSGPARSSSIQIAGQSFAVSQDGTTALNTPTGANVSVPLLGGAIRVFFPGVVTAGVTTVTPLAPCPPNQCGLPAGYARFGNLGFDIQTTAATTGPITLAFDLARLMPSPPPITPPLTPSPPPISPQLVATLRVLHGEGGSVLVDRTVPPDPITPPDPVTPPDPIRTIFASVTSLSPFVIAQLGPEPLLQVAHDGLVVLRPGTTDPRKGRALDIAIGALQAALRSSYWMDPFHVTRGGGVAVAVDTALAVASLAAYRSDPDVLRAINQILGADLELVQTIVAEHSGG